MGFIERSYNEEWMKENRIAFQLQQTYSRCSFEDSIKSVHAGDF